MNKSVIMSLAFLIISISSFSQKIVEDKYSWHDSREIKTEEIDIPVYGDVKVKMGLLCKVTKGLPTSYFAMFDIAFRKTNSEHISYNTIIKTSSGKIYEEYTGSVLLTNLNSYFKVPITWTTISWFFDLNKKTLKKITKENVVRIKIRIKNDSIDLILTDETLTNFIREGYKVLKERAKTKLPESENPPKYNGF